MLEILILMSLGRNIARRAHDKGRSGAFFVVLLVVLWFGGEICGAIAGAVVGVVGMGQNEPPLLLCYLGALTGAAIGAVIAFVIVSKIAPLHKYDDDYDDEYEEHDAHDPDRHERERKRDPNEYDR